MRHSSSALPAGPHAASAPKLYHYVIMSPARPVNRIHIQYVHPSHNVPIDVRYIIPYYRPHAPTYTANTLYAPGVLFVLQQRDMLDYYYITVQFLYIIFKYQWPV